MNIRYTIYVEKKMEDSNIVGYRVHHRRKFEEALKNILQDAKKVFHIG